MTRKNYVWKIGEELPELAPHSLAKHRIYRRYIERYIEILTATSGQEELNLTIVDGDSGGGAYRLGRDIVEGSPLIMLRPVLAAEFKLKTARHQGLKIKAPLDFPTTRCTDS